MPVGPWQDKPQITQRFNPTTHAFETSDGFDLVGNDPVLSYNGYNRMHGSGRTFSTTPAVDMSTATASEIAWVYGWARDNDSVNWNGGSYTDPSVTNADPTPALASTGIRNVGFEFSYDPGSPGISDFCFWDHWFVTDEFVYGGGLGSQYAPDSSLWPEGAIGVEYEGASDDPVNFLSGTFHGFAESDATGTPTPQMFCHLVIANPGGDGEFGAPVYYWPPVQWGNPDQLASNARMTIAATNGVSNAIDIDVDWLNQLWTPPDPFDTDPDPILMFGAWAVDLLGGNSHNPPHFGTGSYAHVSTVSEPDFEVTFETQRYRYIYPDTIAGHEKAVRRRFVGA